MVKQIGSRHCHKLEKAAGPGEPVFAAASLAKYAVVSFDILYQYYLPIVPAVDLVVVEYPDSFHVGGHVSGLVAGYLPSLHRMRLVSNFVVCVDDVDFEGCWMD